MKLLKGGLILLFLLISLISVYGAETILSDNFDYGDAYTSHGWLFSSPYAEFSTSPITSHYSTNTFGFSGKSIAGSSYEGQIYQSLTSMTGGQFTLSYNFYLGNNSVNSIQPIRAQFYVKGSNSNQRFFIDLAGESGGSNISAYYFDSGSITMVCSSTISTATTNIAGSVIAQFDINAESLTLFYNGTLLGDCSGKDFNPLATKLNITKVLFSVGFDTNEYLVAMVDDIVISTTGVNSSLAVIGEPCQKGEDCQSGQCEYGACTLKQAGVQCTSSIQCASGDCKNGLCTKPSLSQNLDLAMSENFGSDVRSKNMVSLFLMIGIPAVIMIASGGSSIGVLVALACFFVEGFAFTYFGWLSPFILIGIVIVGLIVVVFAFMIKGQTI